ncbi:hypothetical protein TOPH_08103 [Tolypocladium ophioglossoides CBS 100239]|uniref:Uncharacterized protein n=1 Tax=Tolypocladium ophioglossoides (strain CBS 100239) TaxID=1163406 RepID=A0A0L0MZI4_TOLOC|nr:hypothetical protein TOPH_08103 [Tolypocladium ophioglossoides CBS 100239]
MEFSILDTDMFSFAETPSGQGLVHKYLIFH